MSTQPLSIQPERTPDQREAGALNWLREANEHAAMRKKERREFKQQQRKLMKENPGVIYILSY